MNIYAFILSIISRFEWDNVREFLSKKWMIGLSASGGFSVVSWLAVINPILQFVGLSIGIYIGYLTARAKIEDMEIKRKERKPSINPELIQDFKNKSDKAKKR